MKNQGSHADSRWNAQTSSHCIMPVRSCPFRKRAGAPPPCQPVNHDNSVLSLCRWRKFGLPRSRKERGRGRTRSTERPPCNGRFPRKKVKSPGPSCRYHAASSAVRVVVGHTVKYFAKAALVESGSSGFQQNAKHELRPRDALAPKPKCRRLRTHTQQTADAVRHV